KNGEAGPGVDAGEDPNEDCADEMAEGEEFFGVEPAIGDLAGDEGGEEGADGGDGEEPARVDGGDAKIARQISIEEREPCAPDGVLEEHHDGEFEVDFGGEGRARTD